MSLLIIRLLGSATRIARVCNFQFSEASTAVKYLTLVNIKWGTKTEAKDS
jgi:hypothetical protein